MSDHLSCASTQSVILPVREEDLSEILQLEAENPSPWSRSLWCDELRQESGWRWLVRDRRTRELLGFICGRVMAAEAELFKLAVAARHRRRGIATALLTHACRQLREESVAAIFLELRCANGAAKGLYTRSGFVPCGVRKGYYTDPADDALVMRKRLPANKENTGEEYSRSRDRRQEAARPGRFQCAAR